MIILEEELKAIIKQYKLTNDELYRHSDNLMLISARGIRKVITAEKLNVSKRVEFDPTGGVVVIARVEKGGAFTKDYQFYESVGEAKAGLNTAFKYPVAVAEARANSRAVLMSVGLYEKGIIGEAELDMETEAIEMISKRQTQMSSATESLLTKISKKKA
jgi:hypothetical protein